MWEASCVKMINLLTSAKILRSFYGKLLAGGGGQKFYCGIMVSIAGLVSSPLMAVYSASKAGVFKLVEALNIELEEAGSPNRILNISPGSISGTKFNDPSKPNDISQTLSLANEIIDRMTDGGTLFIPQYNEIYRGVIERYREDPRKFGMSSYEYKKASGRTDSRSRVVTGYLSGTFDLFHIGHLNLLRRAKEQCDYLVVGIHPSGLRKGKPTFIPLDERKAIVASCRYVDKVIDAPAEDCDAWDEWHYSKLFVGSDYKGSERFNRYEEIFSGRGVEIVYFPYTTTTSSSQIRAAIMASIQ